MAARDPRQAPGFGAALAGARRRRAERMWPAGGRRSRWSACSLRSRCSASGRGCRGPHGLCWLLFAGGPGCCRVARAASFRFSGRDAGLARIERDSGARHQPLRALDDELPGEVTIR